MTTNFQYVPLVGDLSGESFEKQTARAFNELGANVDDSGAVAREALNAAQNAVAAANGAERTAQEALNNTQSAVDTANNALNAARTAEQAAQSANAKSTQALDAATIAVSDAQNALTTASAAQVNATNALTSAQSAEEDASQALTASQYSMETAENANGIFTVDSSARDADDAYAEAEKSFLTNGSADTPNTHFPPDMPPPYWFMVYVTEDGRAAAQTCWNDSSALLYTRTGTVGDSGPDKPVVTWTPWNTATAPSVIRYELCEFYFFRHPSLRPGFQPCQGGLLENAAALYPEAWAYLQSAEGRLLCKTEAEWQAMTQAIWHTNADGTTVGWNGMGGAPFFAPDTATGALRLPDIRGMYPEAAGFDSLDAGGVHGDGTRNFPGWIRGLQTIGGGEAGGAFYMGAGGRGGATSDNGSITVAFDPARVAPVANKVQPRAYGVLACVYLGQPAA